MRRRPRPDKRADIATNPDLRRPLPPELRADIERFIALMLDKGDGRAARDILKLKKALASDSPVLYAHLNVVAKNALTPGIAAFDMTEEERFLIGDVLNRAEALSAGKPGPPKQYPIPLYLRISGAEQEALGRLSEAAGENHSEVIRRLIREADAK